MTHPGAAGVRPDRDLGQNFLVDRNLLGVIERAARYSDSTPRPPPISRHTSSGCRAASRAMTPRMFESMRKFWPRSRLGRTPNCCIRRRLGWVTI